MKLPEVLNGNPYSPECKNRNLRLYVRVKGEVQGIGYRYFVIRTANRMSLTGWVRNCEDGDVDCEVQGDEKDLDTFLLQMKSGHSWARVDSLQKETLPENPSEKGFQLRYD